MIRRSETTAGEFQDIAERLGPCELVRGEICELSPGGFRHNDITSNIHGLLWQWAKTSRAGRALTNETGVVVETNPDTVRGADVLFISYQRLPKGQNFTGFLTTPPELVVEVIGQGQCWADMVEKAGEYLRMGVDRMWIIDPDSRNVHIYRSDREPVILSEKDTIGDADLLPGFACRVGEFFED